MERGNALPSHVSSHPVFSVCAESHFLISLLVGVSAVENGPNQRAEVPPSVPESRKVLTCLREKHVLKISTVLV